MFLPWYRDADAGGGTLPAWGGYWFVIAEMLVLFLVGAGLALGVLVGRRGQHPQADGHRPGPRLNGHRTARMVIGVPEWSSKLHLITHISLEEGAGHAHFTSRKRSGSGRRSKDI
jgi:hypothetical protein